MATLRYTTNLNSVATNVDSVVLSDPTGAYGVKRNDTGAVVVAVNAAFTNAGAGVYTYTFAAVAGVSYTAWIKRVHDGKTLYREINWIAAGDIEEVTEGAEITAAETLELIMAYGTEAIFYTGTDEFDPATNETVHSGGLTHAVNVVEENRYYQVPDDADILLYFSPSGLSWRPEVGKTVDYKGQHWTIMRVSPTVFQGVTLLWTIAMKGVP